MKHADNILKHTGRRRRMRSPFTAMAGATALTVGMVLVGAGPASASTPTPWEYCWGPGVPGATGFSQTTGFTLTSANKVYHFYFQGDGNLVVYHGNKPIWSSNTFDSAKRFHLRFTALANGSTTPGLIELWIPNVNNNPVTWTTDVYNRLASDTDKLIMQNNGNLVEYDGNSCAEAAPATPIWATGTNGK